MDKEFNELYDMYQNVVKTNDIAKQNEILQAMRENVKRRGGDVSEETSYGELLQRNGQLNQEEEKQRLTEFCDQEREKQTSRNKYRK